VVVGILLRVGLWEGLLRKGIESKQEKRVPWSEQELSEEALLESSCSL
jgi:hypothetical protein